MVRKFFVRGKFIKSTSCLHLPALRSFLKNPLFSLFPIEKPKLPNLRPCHKIGQGQPRVIFLTNYDGPESPMLHTKFRGNR